MIVDSSTFFLFLMLLIAFLVIINIFSADDIFSFIIMAIFLFILIVVGILLIVSGKFLIESLTISDSFSLFEGI